MEDSDPSWYLGSYDLDIQEAYMALCEPPLNLEQLRPGNYKSAIEQQIYRKIHELLVDFPASFPDAVKRLLHEAPNFGTSQMTRYVDPKVRCSLLLDYIFKDLRAETVRERRVEAEEKSKHAEDPALVMEALNASLSSVYGSDDILPDDDQEVMEWVDSSEPVENGPTPKVREVSPTKRPTECVFQAESSMKRSRKADSDFFASRENISTSSRIQPPISADGQYYGKFGPPRKYDRTDSTKTTSTWSRTNSSSTTMSVNITPLTTPTTSLPSTSTVISPSKESGGYRPLPPLPLNERIVLVLPPSPLRAILSALDVQFGIQWELERLVSRYDDLTWDDFAAQPLETLQGTAEAVMPRLYSIIDTIRTEKGIAAGSGQNVLTATFETQIRRRQMLREMDLEEDSPRKNDLRGVWNDSTVWPYGGKIAYNVIVRPTKVKHGVGLRPPGHAAQGSDFYPTESTGGLGFDMTLSPPTMPGKSFRLARRYGSRRVISFKLKDFRSNDDKGRIVSLFMGRQFEVLDKTYRAVWAPPKGDTVYALEMGSHDKFRWQYDAWTSEPPSFQGLWSVFNDMAQKPSQAMAKWAARPQLLFSDTVPAAQLAISAIGFDTDIVSVNAVSYDDATTEQILTDGCGLMSEELAQRLRLRADMPRPSVVQVRIGGSKGLLVVMSPAQHALYAGQDIVLSDSMVKALSSEGNQDDPSLLTIDVVKYDALRLGTSLSAEAIVNMEHNGVPSEVLLRMARQSMDDLAQSFSTSPLEGETEEDVNRRNVNSGYRRGGVGTDRKKRDLSLRNMSASVSGLSDRDAARKEEERFQLEDDSPGLIHSSEQYLVDPISKQPGSIAESLMLSVAAGFNPLQSYYAGQKLHCLMDSLTDGMVRSFRIPVEESCSAFIVPDREGILEPDEIFISFSSQHPIDPETMCPISSLKGSVIIFRSPCKLPTDVREFKAVYRPELAHMVDCVVMSAKATCARSPASVLGGGDYDGDTVSVIWNKALVELFTNAHDRFAEMPVDIVTRNFEKQLVKVSEFLEATANVDEETMVINQQSFLLDALLADNLPGICEITNVTVRLSRLIDSDLHANAVFRLGYDHDETVRLAYISCLVLDARKSGLRLKPEVLAHDLKKYGGSLQWRDWKKMKKGEENSSNIIPVKRDPRMGAFILDRLMDASEAHRHSVMRLFPSRPANSSTEDFMALSVSWTEMNERAQRQEYLKDQSQILHKHVKACHEVYLRVARPEPPRINVRGAYEQCLRGESPIFTKGNKKEGDTSLLRLSQMRQLAEIWRDGLTVDTVPDVCMGNAQHLKRLKVACGSTMESWRSKQIFVFDMDFETTCAIRAESRGGGVGMMNTVAGIMKPDYRRTATI